MKKISGAVLALLMSCVTAQTEELVVQMHLVDASGGGKSVGAITATEGAYGVVLTPNLQGLTPGVYGFHLHQNPNCMPGEKEGRMVPGLAAGGHFDPAETGKHLGPYNDDGHLGDLPTLYVDSEGHATIPVLAPRLKLSDMKGRSLMIHAGGDNYSDQPQTLGGGGARMVCGVIE